ncbi:MAG: hypothetical protein HW388_928 [Dehalococcoidia bacterium]|nr:hypothetical protein [Dehalococcoidia bacterium]
MAYQVYRIPVIRVPRLRGKGGFARRVLPLLIGLLGGGFLVLLYLGIVTWAQGWDHALELLSQDRVFVAAIATGFGLQVGLYAYMRLVVHHEVRLAMPTCCLHHVTDVLPLIGLSGAAVFLNDYRIPFMVGGLVVNGAGVIIMLRVILQGRAHLRALRVPARTEAQ